MNSSIMQSDVWADFKTRHGWHAQELLGFYVLSHPLKGGYDFRYIPEIVPRGDQTFSEVSARSQAALSKSRTDRTVFGRAEFLIPYTEHRHLVLVQAGFIAARDQIQPKNRQVIDLNRSLSTIRDGMRPKGRYNLGLAIKKGVIVTPETSDQSIKAFLQLNHQTARRKGFIGRGDAYLSDLIDVLGKNKMGGLYVARFDGQILSAAIISFYGDRASYLYGVSANEHRSVMSPYALHFAIIEEAKRRGCSHYDLIGIAPADAPTSHPWAGITRFKREFGGESVQYLGSYDRVYRPLLYTVYRSFRRK